MKNYLLAWWRGIRVIGLYLMITIVMAGLGFVIDLLSEKIHISIGIVLAILLAPPMHFWIFRSVYPEIVKSDSTAGHRNDASTDAKL